MNKKHPPKAIARSLQVISRPIAGKTLVLGFLLFLSHATGAQSKYVQKYRPLADSLSAAYGIPVSIILGVAILESGAGTSRNCKLLKNHFGIVGKNDLLKTHGIRSRYKQYPSDEASYIAFCKLMTRKKFYTGLKGNTDYRLWVDAISKAGYSEVPEDWKKKVLATIRKSKLSTVAPKQE